MKWAGALVLLLMWSASRLVLIAMSSDTWNWALIACDQAEVEDCGDDLR